MNVLFFTPPSRESFVRLGRCGGKSKGGEKWPPVKLMFGAGMLRESANVKIIDADANLGMNDFLHRVKGFGPDLVIFEPTPSSLKLETEAVKEIKKIFPGTKALCMGGFATPLAEELLTNFEMIDYVVAGEAEKTLEEFIKTGKIVKGLWYRKRETIRFAGERGFVKIFDELPFPAHEMIDKKLYNSPVVKRRPFTITESSRGCPYGCVFCNARFLDGKVPRFRSTRKLIEEMSFISSLGFREVKFNDETFTLNRKRVIDFTNELIRQRLDLTWKCNTRADFLDLELLRNMKKSGCHAMFIGVESADPEILKYYKKGISLRKIEDAVKKAKSVGIKVILHFIFGAPDEDWDSIRRSVRFALRIDPDYVGFNILTPYPGTEVYKTLHGKYFETNDWGVFDQSHTTGLRTKHLSSKDLEEAVRTANRTFYMRPRYIAKRILSIRTRNEFYNFLRSGYGFLEKF